MQQAAILSLYDPEPLGEVSRKRQADQEELAGVQRVFEIAFIG